MAVTINKWDNWEKAFLPETSEGQVTSFIEPANKTMVLIYLEVTSGTAVLALEVEEESIPGLKFAVSSYDGLRVEPTIMEFGIGNYRIPVPMAENEEKLHITLAGTECQLWSILESEKN